MVTSGTFTRDALEFISGRNIEANDGPALLALVRGIDPKSVLPLPVSHPRLAGNPVPPAVSLRTAARPADPSTVQAA